MKSYKKFEPPKKYHKNIPQTPRDRISIRQTFSQQF
jgi:hypothetical protein